MAEEAKEETSLIRQQAMEGPGAPKLNYSREELRVLGKQFNRFLARPTQHNIDLFCSTFDDMGERELRPDSVTEFEAHVARCETDAAAAVEREAEQDKENKKRQKEAKKRGAVEQGATLRKESKGA